MTKVVLFTSFFRPGWKGGGPIRSTDEIIRTRPSDVDLLVVTRDRDLGDEKPYPGLTDQIVPHEGAQVLYVDIASPRSMISMLRVLRRAKPDVVITNGFFEPYFAIAPMLLHVSGLLGARLVLSPRGEFSPGALALKATKKQRYLGVARPLLSRRSISWLTTGPRETRELRVLFPHARIHEAQNTRGNAPAEKVTHSEDNARLVFISRISPKKNVHLGLAAIRQLGDSGVTFDIYGPLEDQEYWAAQCQPLIDRMPPGVNVNYRGSLAPHEVGETFAKYDAFVFPTLGENFGHVVHESLAVGCPVVAPDTTPWTPVLQKGAGWVLPLPDEQSLTFTLQAIAASSAAQRTTWKQNALDAYARWHHEQPEISALQIVVGAAPQSGAHA